MGRAAERATASAALLPCRRRMRPAAGFVPDLERSVPAGGLL